MYKFKFMGLLLKHWWISSKILCEEWEKLWLEVEIVSEDKNLFYIKWKWKNILFKSTDFWGNTSLWVNITEDKELTYKMLERLNVPIAKSWYLTENELSTINDMKIDFPVVIKPINEAHWDWVITNISNIKELEEKLKDSFIEYNKMIIQKQINWDEVRILVVKWEVILAKKRIPAFVTWNGKDDLETLIENENTNNPLRWEKYNKPLSYIKIDKELTDYISKKWLSTKHIPKKWENVQLRWTSNVWTWWIPIDVSDKISEDIKMIACKATKAMWLKIAWVDIMTSDITKPLNETGG